MTPVGPVRVAVEVGAYIHVPVWVLTSEVALPVPSVIIPERVFAALLVPPRIKDLVPAPPAETPPLKVIVPED